MPKRSGRKRYLRLARFIADKRGPPKGLGWLLQQEEEERENAEARAREAVPVLLREPPRTPLPPLFLVAPPVIRRETVGPRIVSDVRLETRVVFTSARTVEPYVPEHIIPGPPPPDVPYVPSGPPTSYRGLTAPGSPNATAATDLGER